MAPYADHIQMLLSAYVGRSWAGLSILRNHPLTSIVGRKPLGENSVLPQESSGNVKWGVTEICHWCRLRHTLHKPTSHPPTVQAHQHAAVLQVGAGLQSQLFPGSCSFSTPLARPQDDTGTPFKCHRLDTHPGPLKFPLSLFALRFIILQQLR